MRYLLYTGVFLLMMANFAATAALLAGGPEHQYNTAFLSCITTGSGAFMLGALIRALIKETGK